MKPIDLTKVLKGHTSGWVALSPDYKKVVGHGKTLKKALEEAFKKGIDAPILMRAAKSYGGFVTKV